MASRSLVPCLGFWGNLSTTSVHKRACSGPAFDDGRLIFSNFSNIQVKDLAKDLNRYKKWKRKQKVTPSILK